MSHIPPSDRARPAYPTYRGMGDGPVALLVAVSRTRSPHAGDPARIMLTTNNGRLSAPDIGSDKRTASDTTSWWQQCMVVLRHLAQQGKA